MITTDPASPAKTTAAGKEGPASAKTEAEMITGTSMGGAATKDIPTKPASSAKSFLGGNEGSSAVKTEAEKAETTGGATINTPAETYSKGSDKKAKPKIASAASFTAAVELEESCRYDRVPTLVDAIRLFDNIYTMVLKPAFAHPAWAEATPPWGQSFPTRVRALVDILAVSPLDDSKLNPVALEDLFAEFVKVFCHVEMNILGAAGSKPGILFDWAKYGVWCDYRWGATFVPWVHHVYRYRHEWSWGFQGGIRGRAGFIEAVGLWAHAFCRMLDKSWYTERATPKMWEKNMMHYHRACWQMQEYVYKWAVRVNARLDGAVPAIVLHSPADPHVYAAGLSPYEPEHFDGRFLSPHYRAPQSEYAKYDDDGQLPKVAAENQDDDDGEVPPDPRVVDADPAVLAAENEYGVIQVRDDEDYLGYHADAEAEDAERAWFSQQMLDLEM